MSQAMNMMTDMAVRNAGQANLDTQRSRLENLSNSKDQAAKEKELRKACEGFEAIFIQKMWDEMRSSLPKEGMFHSKEEEYWQSMYSQELGKSMASVGGIGLADMMVEQMTRPQGTPQTGALSRIRMAVKPAPLLPENQNTEAAQAEKTAETAQNPAKQATAQATAQAAQTAKQAAVQATTQAAVNPANFYEEYTPNSRDTAVENANANQAPAQKTEEIAEENIQPQIIHTTYTTNLPPSKRTKALLDAKGNPIKKASASQNSSSVKQVSTPQRNTKVVTEKTNFEIPATQDIPEMPITFAGQENAPVNPEPVAPKAEPADMLAGISQTYIPYNQRIAMILASEKAMHAEEMARAELESQMTQIAEQETKAEPAFKLPTLEDALRMGTLVASLSPQEERQIADTQAQQTQAAPEHVGGGTVVSTPPVFEHVSAVAPETSFTMPVEGNIASPFGWRLDPINNKRAWHTGLDIRANEGNPVTAGMQGTVTFAGQDPELGNMVIIDHGNGLETVYGHNSELLVKAGDVINSGTQIARVGSSGRANGSHLHFEIRQNGLSINPEPYFTKEEIS